MFDKCYCKRLNKQPFVILYNLVFNFNMVTLSIHLTVHTIISLAAGTWGIEYISATSDNNNGNLYRCACLIYYIHNELLNNSPFCNNSKRRVNYI